MLFRKNKRYQSFKEDREDLYGEIRSLKKQIKSLTKEISRLRKYEHVYLQDVDFVKKNKEKRQIRKNKKLLAQQLSQEKPDVTDFQCEKCRTFNAIIVSFLNRTFLDCKECGYRKRIENE